MKRTKSKTANTQLLNLKNIDTQNFDSLIEVAASTFTYSSNLATSIRLWKFSICVPMFFEIDVLRKYAETSNK